MKPLLVVFAMAVVTTVVMSFYIMYNARTQSDLVCPAPSLTKDYSLVTRHFPKPVFTVQQLRQYNYSVQKLVASYVDNTLSQVDQSSVVKIGVLASGDVNNEVKRLETHFSKIVSEYTSLLKMSQELTELSGSFSRLDCKLPSSQEVSQRYRTVTVAQQQYNQSLARLPKQDQTISLNDLLYNKAQIQADLKVLYKKLTNLQHTTSRNYLSSEDRNKLVQRKREIEEELKRNQPIQEEDIEDELARLRRQRNLLKLQIEEDELASEYNSLKDTILKCKDNLTDYRRNLTQAIVQYKSRLQSGRQQANSLNKRLNNLKTNFKNILRYNNNLTFHAARKEQIGQLASHIDSLASVQQRIRELEDKLALMENQQKIRSNRRIELQRELNDIEIDLLMPEGPADRNSELENTRREISSQEAKLDSISTSISEARSRALQTRSHSSQLSDFKAKQATYKKVVEEFTTYFRQLQSQIHDCKMASGQLQQKQSNFVGLKNAFEEGWNRLVAEVYETNQTLEPLANL